MKNNNNFFLNVKFSVLMFIFLLTTTTFAMADSHKVELKPGHPQMYTVKKGDTLWDISGKFLTRPWYWPEIWQVNKQIANPHLIYPGDVLRLVYINGRPYITRDGTVRLSPRVRVEKLDQAIPTIPLDIIEPFLSKNRILNAGEYSSSPYIVSLQDGRVTAAANESVYVMGIDKNAIGTNYGVYRPGKAYKSPRNKREVLGYEAVYLGEGSLDRKGSPATLFIEKSKAEILKGHRVLPLYDGQVVNTNFLPKASTAVRPGHIIGVLTSGMQPGVKNVGALDVVVIDLGLEDGAEVGDVFNIYKRGALVNDPVHRTKRVRLPDEINGNLMVFRTFDRLSYALVMDAQNILQVGDIVRSPYTGK